MIRGSEKVIGTVDGFHPLSVSFRVEEGYPALRQSCSFTCNSL